MIERVWAERLRGGDEDVRWCADHRGATMGWCIAGAYGGSNLCKRGAIGHVEALSDAGERGSQVALDIVGEGLERGDIHDPCAVGEHAFDGVTRQLIDAREEGREGLSRACGRSNECMLTAQYGRPSFGLGWCWLAERLAEPASDGGQEVVEDVLGHVQPPRGLGWSVKEFIIKRG